MRSEWPGRSEPGLHHARRHLRGLEHVAGAPSPQQGPAPRTERASCVRAAEPEHRGFLFTRLPCAGTGSRSWVQVDPLLRSLGARPPARALPEQEPGQRPGWSPRLPLPHVLPGAFLPSSERHGHGTRYCPSRADAALTPKCPGGTVTARHRAGNGPRMCPRGKGEQRSALQRAQCPPVLPRCLLWARSCG